MKPNNDPQFPGTEPMDENEKKVVISFLMDVQKIYKKYEKENNKNKRFLYACFNSIIRDLSVNIGQYNNCKISKDAKGRIPDFGEILSIRHLDKAKTGKELVREHVKPSDVLLNEFREGFKDEKDAEKWFNSCEIAFITKEENKKMEDEEKDMRLKKAHEKGLKKKDLTSEEVFDIHKKAYKKTGLDKNLVVFKTRKK